MVSLHNLLTTAIAVTGTTTAAAASTNATLNITVIGAHNNQSTLEGWALAPGFAHSTQPGTEQNMLQVMGPAAGNVSYMVIQPRTDNGLHNAPSAQYVLYINLPTYLFTTRRDIHPISYIISHIKTRPYHPIPKHSRPQKLTPTYKDG